MKLFFTLLFTIFILFASAYAQIITIAEAREDLNGDFIPDRLGDTVTVQGVVFTPRFHNVANQYFIDDGTAGINAYMPAPPTFNWNLGDELQLTGTIDQYFGLTEIVALDSSSWVLISTGNPIPDPVVLTIAQFLSDPETYEGSLIGFISLTMVGGTWPLPNNHANVQMSDGIDTLNMYINRHTDIDDNPEPTWPKDILGIGYQFTSNTPPNDGYQFMPRFYSDFLPPGTIAHNSLTHNTGTLQVTIIDNGYIGNDHTGTYGGVVFNGNPNAMPGSAGAGLIFGRNGEGFGNYGSIFEDFYNDIPIAGFFSTSYFNQYAYYTVALNSNPDSKTFVESLSNTGHDFVFIRANISDNTLNIDDLSPGIFADWDIGNYPLNRGGYDPARNLFYMYENGGAGDASYYGIMGIAVDEMLLAPNTMKGLITTEVAWNRFDLYNFMTSTAFDTITIDGDYRVYTCVGPYSILAGSTLVVDVAIVAGTSLSDLLANADEAISYWQFVVPVETETNNHFTFNLSQNYPNPFNPETAIRFDIPEMSFVTIEVYDVLGNQIETLVNAEKPTGTYEVEFNATDLPSGVYFYQLKAGDFVETKKMILLR